MSANPFGVFVETLALGAVLENDLDKARVLIADMMPGEMNEFERQLYTLITLVEEAKSNQGIIP